MLSREGERRKVERKSETIKGRGGEKRREGPKRSDSARELESELIESESVCLKSKVYV